LKILFVSSQSLNPLFKLSFIRILRTFLSNTKPKTSGTSCQYHVIFCPKYGRKVLTEKIASRLKKLIHQKQEQEQYGYNILDTEMMKDHVHLLLYVNPKEGAIFTITNKIMIAKVW